MDNGLSHLVQGRVLACVLEGEGGGELGVDPERCWIDIQCLWRSQFVNVRVDVKYGESCGFAKGRCE